MDVAGGQPTGDAHGPRGPFERLRAVLAVRPLGTGAHRAIARLADDSLLSMAGASLGRSRLPARIPVVRRTALLGRALPSTRGSAGCGARSEARVVIEEAFGGS